MSCQPSSSAARMFRSTEIQTSNSSTVSSSSAVSLGLDDEALMETLMDPSKSQEAISLIRAARFSGDFSEVKAFVQKLIGEPRMIDQAYADENPLSAMFALILQSDPSQDWLRDMAAEAYKKALIDQNPAAEKKADRFEKAYASLKDPTILLAHLLLQTNVWNDNYDDQMAGLFAGTVSFSAGDMISSEELKIIQEKEGENPTNPILNALEKVDDSTYKAVKWCGSPRMYGGANRAAELFIESRYQFQQEKINEFISDLMGTSPLVIEKYALSPGARSVVCVIGSYGVGKSEFIEKKFEKHPLTVFSVNAFNERLKGPQSSDSDHHFEGFVLKTDLFNRLNEVPALLFEGSPIEDWRFNNLIGRDFAGRQMILEEVAALTPDDAVKAYRSRSNNLKQLENVHATAVKASNFRTQRIQAAEGKKIPYALYCDGILVAKVENGELIKSEGCEERYETLTAPR